MDLFDFFRWSLGTIVAIYAALVTLQWAVGWYKWLAQPHRHTTMLRRYLIVSGLRLKVTTFWGDALVCLLLCVVFAILWHAHGTVAEIGRAIANGRRKFQPLHWRGG